VYSKLLPLVIIFRNSTNEDILLAEPPTAPDSNSNRVGVGHGPGSPPSTPRWVKVSGIIGIVLILLFVILHLAGLGLGGHMHHMQ
jgi:hypothetical protein